MSRPTRRRATTLGTVLLALSVGLTLTLLVATASLGGSQFFSSLDRRDVARNLAEAAIAEGLASVQQGEHYGQAGLPSQDIRVDFGREGSFGYLTFNRDQARSLRMDYSSNHFFSTIPRAGAQGRPVPRASVHLVGMGVCGSSRQQVEALIFKPPFSEGVSCAGRVQAENVLIGGLRDPAAFAGSYDATPHTQKMAGHIFANSSGSEAIRLQDRSDIRGNVSAHGGIKISSSNVQGEVHPRAPPRKIPRLDLAQIVSTMAQIEGNWNWRGAGASPVRGGGDGSAARPMSGYRVIQGPLVVSGDLHLNGAALYVKGDVEIRGAMQGRGAIISTGRASVGKGSNHDPESNLTLCAMGDVSLEGQGKDSSFFQGMVYSEGNIRADNISVMGALVAPGGFNLMQSSGDVTLKNVNVYPCPRQVSVTMGAPIPPQRLRERPPVDEFSDGQYDAISVRVDVSQKRDGQRLHDVYLYYAKDVSWNSAPGGAGWTGNAQYFARTRPDYVRSGPETEPIVFSGLTESELLYQLNETVGQITRETGFMGGTVRTYLTDPSRLEPARPMSGGDRLAPSQIMQTIRSNLQSIGDGTGRVLEFNLSRRLPAQEQYRILLMRELRNDG